MNAPRLQVPRWRAALGLLLAAVLALTPVRALLEASMLRHMLVQAPLLLLAGALLASAAGPGLRAALARWNVLGISGLVAAGAVLGLLMVPRVLDLALAEPAVEAAKFALLLLAGAALALSWRPAGLLVQAFFLGNMLPMTAVAGQLYADSPVRVCNAYLLDDQARLGEWLIALACAAAVLWLAQVARTVVLREERAGRQDAIKKIA
ncbi:MAG: hypothetical protein ABS38_02930 [Acidovorax sp. SCN 68-22]|nr:MAG: hypothetical protein ABS38_02930 [Acidovorax sp. SCN 68-22]